MKQRDTANLTAVKHIGVRCTYKWTLTLQLLIIILGYSHLSQAQEITQTVRGTITERSTEEPIIGATIRYSINGETMGAVSDLEGEFSITNVPLGRHTFTISSVGYATYNEQNVLVTSSKETVLQVALSESTVDLGEVTVRPENRSSRPRNSMASVSSRSIKAEQIDRFAGSMDDPARLATSFAGVTAGLGNNAIVIRGNSPQGVKWVIENVDIPNPVHFADVASIGGGGLTAVSTRLLGSTDFYTGAFPAQYGNALAGVFDLELRNGNNNQHEHTLSIGTIGLDFASEGPLSKKSKASYIFNYRYSSYALLGGLLPEDAQGVRYQDLSFKLSFPTKNRGQWSIWGIGGMDVSGQKAETDSTQWVYARDFEEGEAPTSMGATGISFKKILSNNAWWHNAVAVTGKKVQYDSDRLDQNLTLQPFSYISNEEYKLSFTSTFNKTFGKNHTNRTGIKLTETQYEQNIRETDTLGDPLEQKVFGEGEALLAEAYTTSMIRMSPRLVMNLGLHAQYFQMNEDLAIDPRINFNYDLSTKSKVSIGYGHHSQTELLSIYNTQITEGDATTTPNQELVFSKAHHFVLSYETALSDRLHLKVEPYYQMLYDIPVVEESTYSVINNVDQWYNDKALSNLGEGLNYGIDFTLERSLEQGFYSMLSASLFESKYKTDLNEWYNTKYNRNYTANLLLGKEWHVGKQKQNLFNLNVRMNIMGGERMNPVDEIATHEQQQIVYDETKPYSEQEPLVYYTDLTLSHRKNRKKYSRVWSIQIMNLLGYEEFYGHKYNLKTKTIEEDKEAILMPNISYRIEF